MSGHGWTNVCFIDDETAYKPILFWRSWWQINIIGSVFIYLLQFITFIPPCYVIRGCKDASDVGYSYPDQECLNSLAYMTTRDNCRSAVIILQLSSLLFFHLMVPRGSQLYLALMYLQIKFKVNLLMGNLFHNNITLSFIILLHEILTTLNHILFAICIQYIKQIV
jgi:hypothetical protein